MQSLNNNKFYKNSIISFLIAAILFIGVAPSYSVPSLSAIEHKRKVAKQHIFHLHKLEKKEKNKMVRNQRALEKTKNNLYVSQARYSTLEGQLSDLNSKLDLSVADYNKSNIDMRKRVRQVYKTQRKGMLQLLLSVKDLNSLLDVVYFEKIVLKQDYARIMKVKKKSETIIALKYEIQRKKAILADAIDDINSQKRSIQNEIAKNQNMINKLKTSRWAYEKSERELARQSEYIQSMIARTQSQNKLSFITTGAFLKPIAGAITSPFGWRIHPIFHSRTFHSGVDIAGPYGGSIRASNSGRVIYSGWYGGYGKVVIVDHGKVNGRPTTTLYAHMSSILVGNGQSVKKGQVIGREGSTGYSTGPHCHFEVRINGVPRNPLNYI